MEELHGATRAKAGAQRRRAAIGRAARRRPRSWRASCRGATSTACGRCCSRAWPTSQIAPDPREAAEMALLRLIHAADLPDPAAVLARLSGEAGPARAAQRRRGDRRRPRRSAQLPGGFPGLVELLEARGQAPARRSQLHDHVGLVRFAPPRAGAEAAEAARPRLGRASSPPPLKALTGTRWAGDASATRAASRRCSSRKRWPRRGCAPTCSPTPMSRRCSTRSPRPRWNPSPKRPAQPRKGPDMPNFEEIMKMAQDVQAEMQKAQDNLEQDRGRGRVGRRAGQDPRHRQGAHPRRRASTKACCSRRRRRCSRI